MNPTLAAWLHSFRLRTLPLALSAIIVGSFLSYSTAFDGITFTLAIVTTLLLQILSNLANDYGDSQKGTDNDQRIGPKRAIQSGVLSFQQIKIAIAINVLLCLFSGLGLVFYALQNSLILIGFIALGIAAIAAAIKYTMGKSAYGYMGLGDVFVLLFFGFVGVMGSAYLQTNLIEKDSWMMAMAVGFFATAVLNLNNMRDRESDATANKNTLVVKIGAKQAVVYQNVLVLGGIVASFVYIFQHALSWSFFLPMLSYPLFILFLIQTKKVVTPKEYDPFLKKQALTTFLFAVLFMVGVILQAKM
jgi:1,4-dihydroxy-2-naphthoate octaprenyltransferase